MNLESRNHPKGVGIAQRTRKNLVHIKDQVDQGNCEVHVVVQLVNSLLGLVVVPQAKELNASTQQTRLGELKCKGWPEWTITPEGKTETLGDLIRHIRNGAAHGHIAFSGEPKSRDLSEVMLLVEDGPTPKKGKPWKANWRGEIRGDDLYSFCLRFAEYVEETVG